MTTPKPPAHLKRDGKVFWRSVAGTFDLEAHHLAVLTVAAERLDRVAEARARVKRDGPYVRDRFGQLKAHPALAVERDATVGFLRAARELGLDVDEPNEARPGRLGRNAGLRLSG